MSESFIYEVDFSGPPVGIGSTGARRCTIGAIAKFNQRGSTYCVANEFVASRLGIMLGLPIPHGVMVKDEEGRFSYLSLRVTGQDEAPPPVIPADLARDHPDLVAGIIVFDHWIANHDRHEENMAYVPGVWPPFFFDHANALLGGSDSTFRGLRRLETAGLNGLDNFCLEPFINDTSRFEPWITQIEGLSEVAIKTICQEASQSGLSVEESDALVAFLLRRRRTLRTDLMTRAWSSNVQLGLGAGEPES